MNFAGQKFSVLTPIIYCGPDFLLLGLRQEMIDIPDFRHRAERRLEPEPGSQPSCGSLEKSVNIELRLSGGQMSQSNLLSWPSFSVLTRCNAGYGLREWGMRSHHSLPFLSSLVKADWSLNSEHNASLGQHHAQTSPRIGCWLGSSHSHWLDSRVIRSIVLNLFNLAVFIPYQR